MVDITHKLPGATLPNVPFDQLLQQAGQTSGKMPGIVLRDIEQEANDNGTPLKGKPQAAKFDINKYRVRVKRFVLDGSGAGDTWQLETLIDACVHSAKTRIFMFDRKDSFNKEGDLITVIYYLEPIDAPYSGVHPDAGDKDTPSEGTLL